MKVKIKDTYKFGDNRLLAYLLTAPACLYLVISMLMPLIWAFGTSLTDKRVGSEASFIGFQNYLEILLRDDFWLTIKNTFVFTICSVAGKVLLGMVLALLLNQPIKGRNIYRALLLLPWTIPNVVATLTWKWIYSDVGGVLNHFLLKTNLIHAPIGWTADPSMAMIAVVIINIWKGMPFVAITILAGLQAISDEYYEAAAIDGANAFKRFIHITLPSVKEVLILATLVTGIWTFNNFESVWLMTAGGPLNATQIISTLSYTYAFKMDEIGKALSISVIAFPFILLLVHLATKQTLKQNG